MKTMSDIVHRDIKLGEGLVWSSVGIIRTLSMRMAEDKATTRGTKKRAGE